MENIYQSLQDKAYNHLKSLIENNELQPNVIYSETRMAKELHISRTPFKVALVRLSQDKYIDIIPSKGFQLHIFNEEDIENIYQFRTAIESFCVSLLMEQKDTTLGMLTLRQLAKTVDKMKDLISEENNIAEFQKQDCFFHSTIISFADNKEFERYFGYSIHHQIAAIAGNTKITPSQKEKLCQEHTEILSAIVDSSFTDCYQAVRQHMLTSKNESLAQLHQQNLDT